MSEQLVIYESASTLHDLIEKMNALIGSEILSEKIVEAIEHFDILRSHAEKSAWTAVVLVRIQPMLHLGWQVGKDEAIEIEARQGYETVIGVKPR